MGGDACSAKLMQASVRSDDPGVPPQEACSHLSDGRCGIPAAGVIRASSGVAREQPTLRSSSLAVVWKNGESFAGKGAGNYGGGGGGPAGGWSGGGGTPGAGLPDCLFLVSPSPASTPPVWMPG